MGSIEIESKHVQTELLPVTVKDLTSAESSTNYWRHLAEKRFQLIHTSKKEIDNLKEDIVSWKEKNRIDRERLDEIKTLIEVLQVIFLCDSIVYVYKCVVSFCNEIMLFSTL